jgi:hypothetical protein
MPMRRRKYEPDSMVPELVESVAAERNRVTAEVKELQDKLGQRQRYLRELEATLKALRG